MNTDRNVIAHRLHGCTQIEKLSVAFCAICEKNISSQIKITHLHKICFDDKLKVRFMTSSTESTFTQPLLFVKWLVRIQTVELSHFCA
jgi:hypothetical protein